VSFDTRLLNGLNVLAAIVEAGNFVRAGEALGLTQSGVSRAMQRFEQQLGVRLLDRTPKAVTLTNEGKQFYQEVAPRFLGFHHRGSWIRGQVAVRRSRIGKAAPTRYFPVSHRRHVHPVAVCFWDELRICGPTHYRWEMPAQTGQRKQLPQNTERSC
jgi:DNA-binding MarR family transcriptional regulator